jgi:hypothetical protein
MKFSKSNFKSEKHYIFEGDIVKWKDQVGIVKCSWTIEFLTGPIEPSALVISKDVAKNCKIIGNKYV